MKDGYLNFIPKAPIEKKILVLSRYLSGYYQTVEQLVKEENIAEVWLYQWRQEYNAKFFEYFFNDKNCDFAKPINRFKTLAIIPARGGSKGLAKKAICELNGKPLIAHTIEACKNSKYINRVIVSTDDEEIAEIAKKNGASVPFLRPKKLAGDHSDLSHAIVHATTYLEMVENYWYDFLINLIPTYPLREGNDIDEAFLTYYQSDFQTLISVDEVVVSKIRFFKLENNKLIPQYFKKIANSKIYRQSGFIYITGRRPNYHLPISEYEKWYGRPKVNQAFIVPREKAIDIDTREDLCIAKNMKKKHRLKKHEIKNLPEKLAGLVVVPRKRRSNKIKDNIICLIRLDKTGHIFEIDGKPSICRPIAGCIKSNLFLKIIIVGDLAAIKEIAKWSSLDYIIKHQAFRQDGLPRKILIKDIENRCRLKKFNICVIDGKRPLIDYSIIAKFIRSFKEKNFAATETVSKSEIHPYWCKSIVKGRVLSTFNTPINGMRQLLPEIFVRNKAIVAAKKEEIGKGLIKFKNFISIETIKSIKLKSYLDLAKILSFLEVEKG